MAQISLSGGKVGEIVRQGFLMKKVSLYEVACLYSLLAHPSKLLSLGVFVAGLFVDINNHRTTPCSL